MIAVLIFGAAAGAVLGLRPFGVLVLAPVILLVAAGAIAAGLAANQNLGTVTLGLVAAVASPQIGYFVTAIAARYLRLRAIGWSPGLSRAMQMSIGQELRTSYELPQELPPEMVALLARMK